MSIADVREREIARSSTTQPQGPRGYPLVGVLPAIWKDPLKYFVALSQEYEDVVSLKLAGERVFVLNDAADIQHVLLDNHANYRKSIFYDKLRPILGNGIFLSEKTTWKEQREIAQPAFRGPCLHALLPEMIEATNDMIGRWRARYADGSIVDVCREMMRLTLDIVFRTLLRVKLGKETEEVFDALTRVLRITERRVWTVSDLFERIPTPTNIDFRRSLAKIERVVQRVIEERSRGGAEHHDLLSMLHAAYGRGGGQPNPKALRDQIMSILLAGHETTGNALSWTWFLLSKNPTVRARLDAEVGEVVGNRELSPADVPSLDYIHMVFQEAIRLYPPVWTMSRTALGEDYVGGYRVPKGASVMLCPYAVHRRTEYWDNPEGFEPERFLPERVRERPKFAYFPFGGGPRICIGKQFATLEAVVVTAMLTRSVRLDLIPGYAIEPEPMITLRPRGGLPMRLHWRA